MAGYMTHMICKSRRENPIHGKQPVRLLGHTCTIQVPNTPTLMRQDLISTDYISQSESRSFSTTSLESAAIYWDLANYFQVSCILGRKKLDQQLQ